MNGKKMFKGEIRGDRSKGKELGKELAEKLLSDGGYAVLKELRDY